MTLRRWLALSGVGAAVLFAVSFFGGGGTPNDDASAAKVVSYFRDHRVATQVLALLAVIGAVLLILFAVRLREFLRGDGSDGGLLPNAAFGGAVILAAGVMLDSAVTYALVRSSQLGLCGVRADPECRVQRRLLPVVWWHCDPGSCGWHRDGQTACTAALAGVGRDRDRDPLPRWPHRFHRGAPCDHLAARGRNHHLPKGPSRGGSASRYLARSITATRLVVSQPDGELAAVDEAAAVGTPDEGRDG